MRVPYRSQRLPLPKLRILMAPKLAIPRLIKQQRYELPQKALVAKWSRISKACRRCRIQRRKCDGGKPTCSKCQERSRSCVYDGSWKDRLKLSVAHWSALPVAKDWPVARATDHVDKMKALLQNMRVRATDQDREKIDGVLAQVRFNPRYSSHPIQGDLTRTRYCMKMRRYMTRPMLHCSSKRTHVRGTASVLSQPTM